MRIVKSKKFAAVPGLLAREIAIVDRETASHPYVTCMYVDGKRGSWVSGHYFVTLSEAEADFAKRVAREGGL